MKKIFLIAGIFWINLAFAKDRNFFEQRYRGWYFFEEKSKPNTKEQSRKNNLSPAEQLELFRVELDHLRNEMLVNRTPESVRNYMLKEKEMWIRAEKLYASYDQAKLQYPELRDLLENPVNVHAVKVKRELDAKKNFNILKNLPKKIDLYFFFNSSCRYSKLFSPILKQFGEQYGFKIIAVSSDGKKHEFFKTIYRTELIQNLGIEVFPVVIAVPKNEIETIPPFELIRGLVSLAELEEYVVVASEFLEQKMLDGVKK